jgi:Tol biopolymer transport system component
MRRVSILVAIVCLALPGPASLRAQSSGQKRPMTFLDNIKLRQVGDTAISPDGKWMLYTLSVPEWKDAKSYTDVFLVSIERGVQNTRQMTFTKAKNETAPRWVPGGGLFVFASNRDGDTQLYAMRPDGGEARKITEVKDGVGPFAFSDDGKWLAFSGGKDDDRQLWTLPVAQLETAPPHQVTTQLDGEVDPREGWLVRVAHAPRHAQGCRRENREEEHEPGQALTETRGR